MARVKKSPQLSKIKMIDRIKIAKKKIAAKIPPQIGDTGDENFAT